MKHTVTIIFLLTLFMCTAQFKQRFEIHFTGDFSGEKVSLKMNKSEIFKNTQVKCNKSTGIANISLKATEQGGLIKFSGKKIRFQTKKIKKRKNYWIKLIVNGKLTRFWFRPKKGNYLIVVFDKKENKLLLEQGENLYDKD